jgi:signal transduction histidine kinase
MGPVTLLWCFGAGVATTLAGGCLFLWLMDRSNRASLMLCILNVAVAAAACVELRMFHSATVAEYGEWLRWHHAPAFFALLGEILFVYFYLRKARLWLAAIIIVMRLTVLVVNFLVEPNFNFSHIASLRRIPFLGEQVSTIGAGVVRSGWQQFALASMVLLLAYLLDAAVRQWRMGGKNEKRRALVIGLCMFVPQFYNSIYSQMQIFGVIHAGLMSNFPIYVGMQLVLAYELGRDFFISKRAAAELAKLQSQFARMERVTMLGQLSSALTHELAQPLSANTINLKAALKLLECPNPNIDEVRAILADVNSESQRSAEMLNNMRRLFRDRTIEMRPLDMEQVVQEVVRLVGGEVTSKKITLSLALEPDLPLVLGDRVNLSQVLLNLLKNAIYAVQSCSPDARRIVVEARTKRAKGEVEVTVRDFGHGIPDDIVNKIFTPFFTTKAEGMGMGLALSRTIIEAHGGNLWADQSPKQGGAVFHFTLQQAQDRNSKPEKIHAPAIPQTVKPPVGGEPAVGLHSQRILDAGDL